MFFKIFLIKNIDSPPSGSWWPCPTWWSWWWRRYQGRPTRTWCSCSPVSRCCSWWCWGRCDIFPDPRTGFIPRILAWIYIDMRLSHVEWGCLLWFGQQIKCLHMTAYINWTDDSLLMMTVSSLAWTALTRYLGGESITLFTVSIFFTRSKETNIYTKCNQGN